MVPLDVAAWDVQYSGRKLRIRRRKGETLLQIDGAREPSSSVLVLGEFRLNGAFLCATRTSLAVGSSTTEVHNVGEMDGVGIRIVSATQQFQLVTNPAQILAWR